MNNNLNKNEEYLTTERAIEYMGISKRMLYSLASKRMIPYSKPNGKLMFFKRSDLDAFMSSNHIASMQEIEERANNVKGGRK